MVKTFTFILEDRDKTALNGDIQYNISEKEIQILTDLFRFERQQTKEMQKCLEITESIDSLENITDTQTEIEFTRDEIQQLKNGFQYTTILPERDFWITNFRSLFNAILTLSKQ